LGRRVGADEPCCGLIFLPDLMAGVGLAETRTLGGSVLRGELRLAEP
jgi:hypothetical protein